MTLAITVDSIQYSFLDRLSLLNMTIESNSTSGFDSDDELNKFNDTCIEFNAVLRMYCKAYRVSEETASCEMDIFTLENKLKIARHKLNMSMKESPVKVSAK